MALTAYCTNCQRTVYVEEGNTPICPVCSMPLVETQKDPEEVKDQESSGSGTK